MHQASAFKWKFTTPYSQVQYTPLTHNPPPLPFPLLPPLQPLLLSTTFPMSTTISLHDKGLNVITIVCYTANVIQKLSQEMA